MVALNVAWLLRGTLPSLNVSPKVVRKKGGQLAVDSVADYFTALCRLCQYGGIGYNCVSGFLALVEAYSLGLCIDAKNEKANVNKPTQKEIPSFSKIIRVFNRIVSAMSAKKRKLRQTNLMDLFRTPSKNPVG